MPSPELAGFEGLSDNGNPEANGHSIGVRLKATKELVAIISRRIRADAIRLLCIFNKDYTTF